MVKFFISIDKIVRGKWKQFLIIKTLLIFSDNKYWELVLVWMIARWWLLKKTRLGVLRTVTECLGVRCHITQAEPGCCRNSNNIYTDTTSIQNNNYLNIAPLNQLFLDNKCHIMSWPNPHCISAFCCILVVIFNNEF